MNFYQFFLLLWVIFALLDPDPDPDSEYGSGSGSTDPIEYGSNTDPDPVPDPQPWFQNIKLSLYNVHTGRHSIANSYSRRSGIRSKDPEKIVQNSTDPVTTVKKNLKT